MMRVTPCISRLHAKDLGSIYLGMRLISCVNAISLCMARTRLVQRRSDLHSSISHAPTR
jgi:hypothetical protein